MKVPISWLKDFVDIDLSIAELASLITMAGMEVEAIQIIGLPMPAPGSVDAAISGLEWDREKIVVGFHFRGHAAPQRRPAGAVQTLRRPAGARRPDRRAQPVRVTKAKARCQSR